MYNNLTHINKTHNFLILLESIIEKYCQFKEYDFNQCISLYTIINNEIIYNNPSPYTNTTDSYRRVDHTQQAKRSERLSIFRHKLSKSYDISTNKPSTTSTTSNDSDSDSGSVYDTEDSVLECEHDDLIRQKYIQAITSTSTSTTNTHSIKNRRVMFIHSCSIPPSPSPPTNTNTNTTISNTTTTNSTATNTTNTTTNTPSSIPILLELIDSTLTTGGYTLT